MAKHKHQLHNGKKGAALAIRITPLAQKDEVVEILDDGTLRIFLKASFEEKEANKALTDFLAWEYQKRKLRLLVVELGGISLLRF